MKKIRERITALEGAISERPDPREAALCRLLEALREALPAIPDTVRRIDHGPYGYSTGVEVPGVKHHERLRGLCKRMQENAMTVEDQRVLRSLPAVDLEFLEGPAEEHLNKILQMYDNLYKGVCYCPYPEDDSF